MRFGRYLLRFGEVSSFLGYNAMKDYFPKYEIKANEQCTNTWCIRRQREYQVGGHSLCALVKLNICLIAFKGVRGKNEEDTPK